MSLTLSTSEVTQLETALKLLLSPLAYERVADWRRACRGTLQRLLGADHCAFGLFLDDDAREQDRELDAAIATWLADYHEFDGGCQIRRREVGLELYAVDMLDGRAEGARDRVGIGIESGPGSLPSAFVHAYHGAHGGRTFGRRGAALLRLLLPAFRAGIHFSRTFSAYRERWRHVLDSLGRAALVASPRTDAVHQTPALRALLDQEPEQAAVLHEIAAVADALATPRSPAKGTGGRAPGSMVRDVVTAQARYQLRGAQLSAEAERPAMVVTVDRLNPAPPSDAQLRVRFGLTGREAEVARQLAVGHTNAELAAALGISRHTAERHTERVLGKLGLHSRAGVAAALGSG